MFDLWRPEDTNSDSESTERVSLRLPRSAKIPSVMEEKEQRRAQSRCVGVEGTITDGGMTTVFRWEGMKETNSVRRDSLQGFGCSRKQSRW